MILVTGSNGFVGSALCARLIGDAVAVRGAVRADPATHQVRVGAIDGHTDWSEALAGCDTVIHCAARVHTMSETSANPLDAYRQVNLEGTLNLARQAAAAGLKRFVFVSSIKVNGDGTRGAPFLAGDVPAPSDPYGVSKLEAEQGLMALSHATGIEIVVVRPPLVYGPGVKANFLSLVKLVEKGWPLPFGSLQNRRSMVALDNLVDLLALCAHHPAAAGRVFLVSDGVDLTMGQLVKMIARALGREQRLVPVPANLMRAVATGLGKSAVADRLLDSLQVDIASTREVLQWTPPVSPQEAINKLVTIPSR